VKDVHKMFDLYSTLVYLTSIQHEFIYYDNITYLINSLQKTSVIKNYFTHNFRVLLPQLIN